MLQLDDQIEFNSIMPKLEVLLTPVYYPCPLHHKHCSVNILRISADWGHGQLIGSGKRAASRGLPLQPDSGIQGEGNIDPPPLLHLIVASASTLCSAHCLWRAGQGNTSVVNIEYCIWHLCSRFQSIPTTLKD